MNNKIFISYSSKDKDFVSRLVDSLTANGVSIWRDRFEIKVGDSIIDKISDAIDEMQGIAIVLSNHSIRSNWVRKELNSALINKLAGKSISIFPILLSNCKIPTLLCEYKYADFRKSFDEGILQLLFALSNNFRQLDASPNAEEESISTRLDRISSQCYKSYLKLEQELILLAEIILEVWVQFSIEEDGSVKLFKPTWSENKDQVADCVIDRLIADLRSDHEGIDIIRSADPGLKHEIAASILHFDKKLFVNESQQWTLQGKSVLPFSTHDIFMEIFDKIIPTQFVAAISRFVEKWTNDINLRESEIIYEFIISKYDLGKEGENIKKSWQRWTRTEERLKSLVFFERVGLMCPALFHGAENFIAKHSPLLFRGTVEAFYKGKSWSEQPLAF